MLTVVTALSSNFLGVAQLVYMQFPGFPVALCSANRDLDFGGVTYKGAAGLGSISPIDDSPGEIKGLQFAISGVPIEYLSLALDDAGIVQGTPTTIRLAIVSDAGVVLDAPIDWQGSLDTMPIEENGEDVHDRSHRRKLCGRPVAWHAANVQQRRSAAALPGRPGLRICDRAGRAKACVAVQAVATGDRRPMRRIDWQERFYAFTKARSRMAFVWGLNDCCTFAADAVEALTGVNPMCGFEAYQTEAAAARVVHRAGGLDALATSRLGQPVSPAFAAVGDVVLVENEGRQMLTVCNGTSVIAPGEFGMVALGMESALAAWKI